MTNIEAFNLLKDVKDVKQTFTRAELLKLGLDDFNIRELHHAGKIIQDVHGLYQLRRS